MEEGLAHGNLVWVVGEFAIRTEGAVTWKSVSDWYGSIDKSGVA